MTVKRFWERPQAPKGEPIERWQPLPADPSHPGSDEEGRIGIERHWHAWNHDQLDELQTIAVTAVFQDGAGGSVELGPWSMDPHDARMLAQSLTMLADASEPDRQTR